MARIQVFLGGAANPTTWRKDTAIPFLEEKGISYYNPQVEDWSLELVAIEARAKEEASLLLFVINEQTRAVASMIEASEYVASGRMCVLVVRDIPAGTTLNGELIEGTQLKDLNRGRAYLRNVAKRHQCEVYDN